MKKGIKLATVAAVLLAAGTVAAFAGPFGFEMGMTLEQVQRACGGRRPEHIEDDMYSISPTKKHSSLSMYVAYISPTEGLCAVLAGTEEIRLDPAIAPVKNKFYEIEGALSRSYGKSVLTDDLPSWTNWLYGLKEGSSKLEAQWSPNRNGIVKIVLSAKAETLYTARIYVVYVFANYEKVEAQKDSVF